MITIIKNTIIILFFTVFDVRAIDRITLVLDWHINPNHAPIVIAQQIGAFKAVNLDIEIISPSDPSLSMKLVAAEKADLAITYQPQLHFYIDQGFPLIHVGTLIDTPLNTIITLDKKIRSLSDLKGKKIGFSVSGLEETILDTMLRHNRLSIKDVKMVNVNFQLIHALIAKKVDAIIGGYRNIEVLALKQCGENPILFNVEDYGVPVYDELIIVANKRTLKKQNIDRFFIALENGINYLLSNPNDSWQLFAKKYPSLDSTFFRLAWNETIPLFRRDPMRFDLKRYQAYHEFLAKNHLISKRQTIANYIYKQNK
ncbi:ABC transporter substrate-binding protein [Sodalis sp. CWE]|uniref:ABC transporter substrate-binding protein n=1 Tax=Sodalis sp. CWE TaxID=2803816 RepID=UPI001C7D03BA|nr:ABC transporter substrate-binding protein [Sodalis sp. CWE]MBX4181188.1 ABC transporter substrate-binding protein [Sodalis sp. CWE]